MTLNERLRAIQSSGDLESIDLVTRLINEVYISLTTRKPGLVVLERAVSASSSRGKTRSSA